MEVGATTMTSSEDFVCALYDAHVDRVRGVLVRMLGPGADVEDLTQDVFEVALRRRGVAEAQGRGVGPWLCGVAVKLAQARRRQGRLRQFFGLSGVDDELTSAEDPARGAEASEAKRLVYAALEKLAEKKRTVFVLYELEGLPGDAIAALLGCPLKTVWSRLSHAREEFDVALRRLAVPTKVPHD
jgi:RNA polymerase sigma-70 factor (ECF subfamily)